MTDWQKKYRWVRTWGDETGIDGKPQEDYSAYDGDEYARRIRLELNGPTQGKWQWAGSYPTQMHGSPIMPNVGYCSTAALAAKAVEIYWDASKARCEIQLMAKKDPVGVRGQVG